MNTPHPRNPSIIRRPHVAIDPHGSRKSSTAATSLMSDNELIAKQATRSTVATGRRLTQGSPVVQSRRRCHRDGAVSEFRWLSGRH